MKKLISILAALSLLVSCAAAEETDNMIIGGADGPTSIFLTEVAEPAFGSVTLSFDANITTGYQWTAFVIGGNSVEIDEENSGYVSDPNPDLKDGVGGTHYFKLNALKHGESMIRFTYSRGWDDVADEIYMLVVVEDDLLIYAMDVTEAGVYDGTVLEVNAEDHSVLLNTDRMGEVIARFNENEALPVQGEHIMVYTNGTATMSLPAIVNVIAWNAVPGEEARLPEASYYTSEPAVEGGVLVGAYYHCSGDENGNIFSAGIDWTEDGTLALTVEEKNCYSDPLTVSRYVAAEDSLIRIAEIVNANNMVPWSEREDVLFVCDAAYPQLCLVIAKDDGNIVNTAISAYIDLTDEETAAWKAVKGIILESRIGELIETYQIEAE